MWRSESYDEILHRLRRAKQFWRGTTITEGVLTFLLLALGGLLPLLILESLLHFSAWIRIALCAILVLVTVWAAVRCVFKPILVRRSDEEIALKIEKAFPEIRNALINAVRIGKDAVAQTQSMVSGLMVEARDEVREVPFEASVDRAVCVRRGAMVGVLALGLLVFLVLSPLRFRNALGRLLVPTADIPAMGRVGLDKVEPGDCELLAGSDLTVRATVSGRPGEEFDAFLFFTPHGGTKKEAPMSPEGNGAYSYVMPGVRSSLTYRVEIGGTESRAYTVKVVSRPAVKAMELTLRFPTYTQLDPVTVKNSDGAIQALTGTTAELKIEATKEIAKGWLELSSGKRVPLEVGGNPAVLAGKLAVDGNYTYRVRLCDRNGYEDEDPVARPVTALPDGKPTVTVSEPGKDVEAPVGGKIALVIRGTDDFGITGARLLMKKEKAAEPAEVATWSDFADRKNVCITYNWPFPPKDFHVDDEITYWVEMADTLPPPGPNRATSDKFRVKLNDPAKQRREQVDKFKLWEKRLQEILQQQRDARQEAGKLFGSPPGGGKK